MKIFPSLNLCLSTVLSVGCSSALESDFQVPQVNYPTHWKHEMDLSHTASPFEWHDFHDPLLDRWLQQVIANNNNLAAAVLRVHHSRLEAEKAGINTIPSISASLSSETGHSVLSSSAWSKANRANFSTSYEIDLWGKLARQRDAAEWVNKATEQDLYTAHLALLVDASKNYWLIGFLNQQIDIYGESVAYSSEIVRLTKSRYNSGSISSLDVVNAEQSLLAQKKRLLALQYQRQQALNEQSVLLGKPAGDIVVEPVNLLSTPLPQIDASIPANILSRRPDISAKEWRLREALTNIDIKRFQYYPSFSLTGALGTSSDALKGALNNPMGTLGSRFTLPFLQWRQMRVDVKIARNDFEQRVLEFKQALYKAMAGVDNALSRRMELKKQEVNLHTALALARKSKRLNESRYRHGAIAIDNLLSAQEQYRLAELAVYENRYYQFLNLAQIYLEFGGSCYKTGEQA